MGKKESKIGKVNKEKLWLKWDYYLLEWQLLTANLCTSKKPMLIFVKEKKTTQDKTKQALCIFNTVIITQFTQLTVICTVSCDVSKCSNVTLGASEPLTAPSCFPTENVSGEKLPSSLTTSTADSHIHTVLNINSERSTFVGHYTTEKNLIMPFHVTALISIKKKYTVLEDVLQLQQITKGIVLHNMSSYGNLISMQQWLHAYKLLHWRRHLMRTFVVLQVGSWINQFQVCQVSFFLGFSFTAFSQYLIQRICCFVF